MNKARFTAPSAVLTGDKLQIGTGTWIGHFVTITAGSAPVKIGKNVDISNYAYISCHSTHKRATEQGPKISGPIEIGDNCYIGPYALIECNTFIGHHSIVAARATVRGFFPPRSFIEEAR